MGQAIAVRTDYSSGEVRRLAQRAKAAGQARRLLAIAAVLDGSSREEAARLGGMDRQTLRDWAIRFNEQGPEGLINIPSPGAPAKLKPEHKAFLARIVEEGPIPAIHGVVRWRACDLIMRLHEEFGVSVSDDTIYRTLHKLGFSCWSRTISISTARHRSTRPFRRPRPGGWSSASNGTTRPSTAVGLTSPNPNSGFYPPNASIGAFPTNRPSLRKSPPGKTTATPITPR